MLLTSAPLPAPTRMNASYFNWQMPSQLSIEFLSLSHSIYAGLFFPKGPEGESCWANTPCGNSPPPPLPAPPTTASTQFCGTSVETATDYCWQPCPRGDSDCCLGLTCFDTGSGTCNADYTGAIHFYCGKSWCDAAYSCQDACPGGSNDECPDGSYCYADVPCIPGGPTPPAFPPTGNPPSPGVSPPSGASPAPQYKYCGKDYADATSRCWQPCQSNSDCCFEQSCEFLVVNFLSTSLTAFLLCISPVV